MQCVFFLRSCGDAHTRHLEGSAGIAGFLKSVHVLQNRQVPPNLHFQSLNPHIDLEGFPAVIPEMQVELAPEDPVSGVQSPKTLG